MTRSPPVVRSGVTVQTTVKTWKGALSSERQDSWPRGPRLREHLERPCEVQDLDVIEDQGRRSITPTLLSFCAVGAFCS